jgi:hypothetical protein
MIDFHGEFDQRFPDQNRIAIFILKSISDEKTAFIAFPQTERKIGSRFSCENRSAILILKSICDFRFAIGSRIYFFNRDRDPG